MKSTDILNYLKCNYMASNQCVFIHISGNQQNKQKDIFDFSLRHNKDIKKQKTLINFQLGSKIEDNDQIKVINVQQRNSQDSFVNDVLLKQDGLEKLIKKLDQEKEQAVFIQGLETLQLFKENQQMMKFLQSLSRDFENIMVHSVRGIIEEEVYQGLCKIAQCNIFVDQNCSVYITKRNGFTQQKNYEYQIKDGNLQFFGVQQNQPQQQQIQPKSTFNTSLTNSQKQQKNETQLPHFDAQKKMVILEGDDIDEEQSDEDDLDV